MVERSLGQLADKVKRCERCSTEYPVTHESSTCSSDGGNLVVAAADRMIGSVVAERYVVTSLLGIGGWSSVYLAEDKDLRRPVAVKILHSHLSNTADKLKRFRTEALSLAGLHHPHITMVLDFGIMANGQPFIVMERLDGQTLEDLVRAAQAVDPKRAVDIAGQICDALEHAHAHGFIHRDLKPSNIMVLDADFVKLLDFGLAKCIDGLESLTATGQTVGTPTYMSPEQCRGEEVDRRADIYSLGSVVYYMLTGEPPFSAENTFEMMYKQIYEQARKVSDVRSDLRLPDGLENVVLRAINKDPGARFATCAEFKAALQGGVTSASAIGTRATRWQLLLSGSLAGNPRIARMSVVLLILVVVAAATFDVYRQTPSRQAGEHNAAFATAHNAPHSTTSVHHDVTLPLVTKLSQQSQTPGAPILAAPRVVPTTVATQTQFQRSQEQPGRTKGTLRTTEPAPILPKAARLPSGSSTAEASTDRTVGKTVPPSAAKSFNSPASSGSVDAEAEDASSGNPISDVAHGQFRARWLKSDDQAIAMLSKVDDCQIVRIVDSNIDDTVLDYVLKRFPRLHSALFFDTHVTDNALDALARSTVAIANLGQTLVTDAGMEKLQDSRLRQLGLGRLKGITDRGVATVSHIYKLTSLQLPDTKITDSSGDSLKTLHMLKILNVAGTRFGDVGVSKLVDLPLGRLDLSFTPVTDGCAGYLASMPSLRELNLAHTAITDAGLGKLRKCPHLERLDLSGTKVSGDVADILISMPELRGVKLAVPGWSADEIAKIQQSLLRANIEVIPNAQAIFTVGPWHQPRKSREATDLD